MDKGGGGIERMGKKTLGNDAVEHEIASSDSGEDTVKDTEILLENSDTDMPSEENTESENIGSDGSLVMQSDMIVMPPPVNKRRWFGFERRRAACGYIFVAPFIIGFIVFMVFPLITSFYWSLTDGFIGVVDGVSGFHVENFLWFRNYGVMVSENFDFTVAILDTMQRTFIWTPFIIVFSLFIAIMLNRKIRFRGMFRVIYFLPVLLGTGFVMQRLGAVTDMLEIPLRLEFMLQYIIGNAHVEEFLNDLLANIMTMFWRMGVQIVIFLAGLQGISDSYYEAAKVDSANWWDMLWKITLPMLSTREIALKNY